LANHQPDPNSEHEVIALRNKLYRLEILLRIARRAYADMVAAARAALTAHADGEPDPWSYLRDELPPPPPSHPLADKPARGERQ
jgi:hypothetical protein